MKQPPMHGCGIFMEEHTICIHCVFQVNVDILVELMDPNAETLHWLDCLQAASANRP